MPTHRAASDPATGHGASLDAFGEVSDAVETGAGLPAVARATARALDASVAVLDASGQVAALACRSPEDERALLSGRQGAELIELRVADAAVGELRLRARGEPPAPALLRMVGALIALEVERSTAPERATEAAVGSFLTDVLDRRTTDRDNIVARGRELGVDLGAGGSVILVRAHPRRPEAGDWRGRVLSVVERSARVPGRGALAAAVERVAGRSRPGATDPRNGAAAKDHEGEIVVVVPGADAEPARRAAEAVRRELEQRFPEHWFAVGRSRPAADPVDLHRAGAEALLAANVADARGLAELAFEGTGAYRLLLPALTEDAQELERFHEETLAPLVAYDEQYETELLRTLETFLDADASVASTAQELFTHRHTVRYRLERIRELTGLDVGSTDGRERLGLGLKAMRVLGVLPPRGPATEPGTEAGRVPRDQPHR